MTPDQLVALLRLIADLYAQVAALQAENAELRQAETRDAGYTR